MTCEFNSQKDFAELLYKLNAYNSDYKDSIKIANIIQQINPNKQDLSEEEKCLLTLLTGYLSWLKGDRDRTLGHLKELAANPTDTKYEKSVDLYSPIFSSAKLTSLFLRQQAVELFNSTFPLLDFDKCMNDKEYDISKGIITPPTFKEFITIIADPTELEKVNANPEYKEDIGEIAKQYKDFYEYTHLLQQKNIQIISFLLKLSILLQLFEKQQEFVLGGKKTKRKNNKTKRKNNKTKRGGVGVEYNSFIIWLLKHFNIGIAIVAASGIVAAEFSEDLPTLSDVPNPLVAGICMLALALYKQKIQYFNLKREQNFPNETLSSHTEEDGTPYIMSKSTTWWDFLFRTPGKVLNDREVSIRVMSLCDQIIHNSNGNDNKLIDDFTTLVSQQLYNMYKPGLVGAIDEAVEMVSGKQSLVQMNQQQLPEFGEGNSRVLFNGLKDLAEVTPIELRRIRREITTQFTDELYQVITIKLHNELKLGRDGIDALSGMIKTESSEINKENITSLQPVIVYLLASASIRETITGNLVKSGVMTQKFFNSVLLSATCSAGTFVLKHLGSPDGFMYVAVFLTIISIMNLITSDSEASGFEEWYNTGYDTSEEKNKISVFANLDEKDKFYQKLLLNDLKRYETKAIDALKPPEPDPNSSWTKLKIPDSETLRYISYGMWTAGWYFKKFVNFPILRWVFWQKLYADGGDHAVNASKIVSYVPLIFAAISVCNSYSNNRNVVIISAETLKQNLIPFTFQLERLRKQIKDEGGRPSSLGDLVKSRKAVFDIFLGVRAEQTQGAIAFANQYGVGIAEHRALTGDAALEVQREGVDIQRRAFEEQQAINQGRPADRALLAPQEEDLTGGAPSEQQIVELLKQNITYEQFLQQIKKNPEFINHLFEKLQQILSIKLEVNKITGGTKRYKKYNKKSKRFKY